MPLLKLAMCLIESAIEINPICYTSQCMKYFLPFEILTSTNLLCKKILSSIYGALIYAVIV